MIQAWEENESDLLPTTNEYTRREDRQLQITAPAVIRKVQNKQY